MNNIVPVERIENKIYFIRGQKVMLDRDLAELYGVKTKVLNQAVKRNVNRFPKDFMFKLTEDEILRFQFGTSNLRSQIVTSNSRSQIVTLRRGHNIKYLPFAFTEQGIAMLSSVLNSKRAIQVNIQIMRTFTKLRQILASNSDLQRKIEMLEQKYDRRFKIVFDAIKALMEPPQSKKKPIGFLREKN